MFCLLLLCLAAGASTGTPHPIERPDTLHAARADSSSSTRIDSAATDTLGRMSMPSLVGTLDSHLDGQSYRTREDLHWLDYRYLGGILETFPGVFIRNQSSDGQYNEVNVEGTDWRAVALSSNGRPLNDPASGVYNLYYFTTEYADRIEFVSGPRAFLYGLNSTGAAVNLITKNYNSNRAFTKLNYQEGPDGYAYVDGTFSQNVSRRMNLTVGFQHQTTDGRFTNSAHDAWNTREKIRYNLGHDFNLVLSHTLTSTETGLNGGVNIQNSGITQSFLTNQAVVRNNVAYEKETRHDADLSLIGTILGDTSNVTTLTLYYSHALREYRDDETPRISATGVYTAPNGDTVFADHRSSWMGGTLTQNYDTGLQRFAAGGMVELRQIEGSPNLGRRRNVIGALWAKEELLFSDVLTVAGFGRYDRYLQKDYAGVGADATLHLAEGISLYGGGSLSRRLPNYQELYWTDSTVTRTSPILAEHHRTVEAGATITLQEAGTVSLSYFHRTVTQPITFSAIERPDWPFPGAAIANGPAVFSNGIDARINLRVWLLALEGTAEYLTRRSGGAALHDFPKLSGSGGIFFWSRVLGNKLELKTGFRGRFALSQDGLLFNPEVTAYVTNPGPGLGTNSSVDLFLIAHIGDAFVQFMWENITNVQYFGTPFYPGNERALRFGISWEFLN